MGDISEGVADTLQPAKKICKKKKKRHAIFQKDMPENYWYDIQPGVDEIQPSTVVGDNQPSVDKI